MNIQKWIWKRKKFCVAFVFFIIGFLSIRFFDVCRSNVCLHVRQCVSLNNCFFFFFNAFLPFVAVFVFYFVLFRFTFFLLYFEAWMRKALSWLWKKGVFFGVTILRTCRRYISVLHCGCVSVCLRKQRIPYTIHMIANLAIFIHRLTPYLTVPITIRKRKYMHQHFAVSVCVCVFLFLYRAKEVNTFNKNENK